MSWQTIHAPAGLPPPRPITVRVQFVPPRHAFAEHSHAWHQLAYAISGVLTAAVEGRTFVISPEQALWLPAGVKHRVGSLMGAEFRSLWIAQEVGRGFPATSTVFAVAPLLKELIVEAAAIKSADDGDGYAGRVTALILDQLRRARALPGALPWPKAASALLPLCEVLYADPAERTGPAAWGKVLAMSERTLARRFEEELGMSLRSWRRRLRLFKAIEHLGGGMDVTRTAYELGYGSISAFIYAFRTEMGCSPQVYMRSGGQQGSRADP